MPKKTATKKLVMPTHPGAETHRRIMTEWAQNPARVLEASKKAGVHRPDGTLSDAYRPTK